MKLFFDLLPVVFFFVAYWLAKWFPGDSHALVVNYLSADIPADQAPILIATFVAIVAAVLQIAITLLKRQTVGRMSWISLAVISVLGGATLAFHDPLFMQWKPTALYWLFAVILVGAQSIFRQNFIRRMLEGQIRLPDPIWSRLNLAWASFFLMLGGLNLYVAFSFSMDTWVNFKVFGCSALILVFALAQGLYLSKHVIEDSAD